MKSRNLIILVLVLIAALLVLKGIGRFLPTAVAPKNVAPVLNNFKISGQESVVDVVKAVGPSVVTVGAQAQPQSRNSQNDPFGFFFDTPQAPPPSDNNQTEDYIGSGFVVDSAGTIVTNKHVVSDSSLKYIIVDSKGNKYTVSNIYRDPLNDIAILKVSNPPSGGFTQVSFGDSDKLEVGQFAIAIGTALGQFRNTVTTGVISGLGRGISAGSPFEGFVEQLDNVIQTDAAINPGNSGGPLLNAAGQVIGINTAVASQGQNIGFAIPIKIVKQSLDEFNKTGQFNRPFLGVSYVLISRNAAIMNDLPEGALVRDIVSGSAADRAGVKIDDIITKIDGQKLTTENTLATIVAKKKVGDSVSLTVWRDSKTIDLKASLGQVTQ